jgi:hypothetical protein
VKKPRISRGRENKTHPGTNAPPGTTWRVDGGDKINQTLQEKGCESSSGSAQAVTRVNIEQASKRAMRTPSPLILGEGWHPEGKTLVQGDRTARAKEAPRESAGVVMTA